MLFRSIGEGAYVENAILDKEVVVRAGSRLVGAPENPVMVKKGEVV